jgi:hypothetical protein
LAGCQKCFPPKACFQPIELAYIDLSATAVNLDAKSLKLEGILKMPSSSTFALFMDGLRRCAANGSRVPALDGQQDDKAKGLDAPA